MYLSLHKYFRFLDGLSDFGTPLGSERCLLTRWTNKKNKWIQRDKLVLCQVESSGRGLINVFSVFCFSVCKITQKLTRLDPLDGGVERGQNKKPLNLWCKCSLHIKTARKENGLGRGLCFHSVPSSFIKRISYICTILHTTLCKCSYLDHKLCSIFMLIQETRSVSSVNCLIINVSSAHGCVDCTLKWESSN